MEHTSSRDKIAREFFLTTRKPTVSIKINPERLRNNATRITHSRMRGSWKTKALLWELSIGDTYGEMKSSIDLEDYFY